MGAMDVAVKQLQPGASEEEKIKFLQEAAINGQFRHPNIVKLMGVVTTGEPVSKFAIGFFYHALEIIMFILVAKVINMQCSQKFFEGTIFLCTSVKIKGRRSLICKH